MKMMQLFFLILFLLPSMALANPTDARRVALGDVFMSFPDDDHGVFYNPAFLSRNKSNVKIKASPAYGVYNGTAVEKDLDFIRNFFSRDILSVSTLDSIVGNAENTVKKHYTGRFSMVLPHVGFGYSKDILLNYSLNSQSFRFSEVDLSYLESDSFYISASYNWKRLYMGINFEYKHYKSVDILDQKYSGEEALKSQIDNSDQLESRMIHYNLGLAYRFEIQKNPIYLSILAENILNSKKLDNSCDQNFSSLHFYNKLCTDDEKKVHLGLASQFKYSPDFKVILATEIHHINSSNFNMLDQWKTGIELEILKLYLRGGFQAHRLSGFGIGLNLDPFRVHFGQKRFQPQQLTNLNYNYFQVDVLGHYSIENLVKNVKKSFGKKAPTDQSLIQAGDEITDQINQIKTEEKTEEKAEESSPEQKPASSQ